MRVKNVPSQLLQLLLVSVLPGYLLQGKCHALTINSAYPTTTRTLFSSSDERNHQYRSDLTLCGKKYPLYSRLKENRVHLYMDLADDLDSIQMEEAKELDERDDEDTESESMEEEKDEDELADDESQRNNSKHPKSHYENVSLRNTSKNEALLTYATHNIIHNIKPGSLSPTELGSIPGLMAAWTNKKKRTSKSNAEIAIIVEQLLKRVIDERKAGNDNARATTRMYTMVR